MDLQIVRDFVYEYMENITESSNGEHFHCKCPICGDSKKSKAKKRFHLDYNDGNPIYHCFNCEDSGTFLQIYSFLKGITINDAKKELYNYNPNNLIQVLSNRKKERIVDEIEYDNFNYILDDCIGIDQEPKGYIQDKYLSLLKNFITDRNLPKTTKFYVAYKGKFQSRVIIPIFDNKGNIIYFQGRRLFDNMDQKYMNPTLSKGKVILNRYEFDKTKFIIITEGIIDALSIGNNGTSILGKVITDDFLEELFPLTDKGIIIALDNDSAGIKSLKTFMKKSRYSKKVKYFLFPEKYKKYKDINNYMSKEMEKNVYEFVTNNSYTFGSAYVKLYL